MLEAIGAFIVKEVTRQVVEAGRGEIHTLVTEIVWAQQNNAKWDQQAEEIKKQAKEAKTLAEKDALIDKLFNARPKFN